MTRIEAIRKQFEVAMIPRHPTEGPVLQVFVGGPGWVKGTGLAPQDLHDLLTLAEAVRTFKVAHDLATPDPARYLNAREALFMILSRLGSPVSE